MQWIKRIDPTELTFSTTKSGGPGGQKVNKTNSAVVLRWSVLKSKYFNEEQKQMLVKKLQTKLNSDGEVVIRSEEFRSQELNRKRCLEKLNALIEKSLFVPKKRKPSKPSLSSVLKNKKQKETRSELKKTRRKVEW